MQGRVIRIERVAPREGVTDEPEVTTKGYRLGDPAIGKRKHHAEHSVFVRTLDEAADLCRRRLLPVDGSEGQARLFDRAKEPPDRAQGRLLRRLGAQDNATKALDRTAPRLPDSS